MESILGAALVLAGAIIAGFAIRIILRRKGNISFSLNPKETKAQTRMSSLEWRRNLVRITLRGAPAVLYGLCQASFGMVLVLINAPALLDSSRSADADPYTMFMVYVVLGMGVAIAWQMVRNVKHTFESDEIQGKIAETVDDAMSKDSDPSMDRKEL